MSGSSSRVSIRKTIQNLKEIAKNHSDDEIYAMLKECDMDPNETAQKLLFQDPFHEVKRKRDKKKENNREPADNRGRPAVQGRVGRGGRGNYSSQYSSHDAGGGRNIIKENGIYKSTDKGITSPSSPPSQDTESKPTIPIASSEPGLMNGPAKVENPVPFQGSTFKDSSVSCTILVKESPAASITNETGKPSTDDGKRSVSVQHVSSSRNYLGSSPKPLSSSGLYASSSDPVLVPTLDPCIPSGVGVIKREATVKKVVCPDVSGSDVPFYGKGSSDMNDSYMHEKTQGKSHGSEGNQFSDSSQTTHSLSHTSSAGSRPSSNYSNRSQQLNGHQRAAGPVKEWKPKSTNAKPAPVPVKLETTDVEPTTKEAVTRALPSSSSMILDDPTSKLQSKLEELQFSDTKHVIIPNHLQVPVYERTGLSFGSFDANFGLTPSLVNDTESEKGTAELSESALEIEENVEESASSIQVEAPTSQEAEIADQTRSPAEMQETLTSGEPDILSGISTAHEFEQLKTEAAPAQDGSEYALNTAPTYSSFGLLPQMFGNQFTTFDGADPQVRDATRMPSFLVQQPLQPFDPATSYYTSMYHTSMYRPTAADGDGRFSPFLAPATKYSGNIAVLPPQTTQTPQESANSLVLSSAGPAPLVTQSAGVMQSSVATSQQSVPVFRQPPGVHISHYPPNYLPYNQYFSPFYIPSPSLHPFLSNAAFPQQPTTGNIYPAPSAAGAAPVNLKYSIPQYKTATNAGNSSHIGIPTGYGTYSPSPVTSGSSTGSEDHASSQYKENNVYIAGQQSEGSVWIQTPGRDISQTQPASFYNIPPPPQHVTFPGIYHHPALTIAAGPVHPMLQQSQSMAGAAEMAGPPSGGVYQHPQRTQINWVNNY